MSEGARVGVAAANMKGREETETEREEDKEAAARLANGHKIQAGKPANTATDASLVLDTGNGHNWQQRKSGS